MGNLAYQKAFRKQQRVSYKNLNENEKKYIKAKEKFEQMDKWLNYFYSHCRRLENGSVDWDNLTDEELNTFDFVNKEKEKALSKMSKLEDVIDVEYTLNVFMQTNTHSMSF